MEIVKKYDDISLNFKKEEFYNVIYTYEYITIQPQEIKTIKLPYFKLINKPLFFEINRNLAEKDIHVLWTNLNEESSKKFLEFIIKNGNIVPKQTDLNSIIGPENKIRIRPNSEFGKIFLM